MFVAAAGVNEDLQIWDFLLAFSSTTAGGQRTALSMLCLSGQPVR